MTSAADDAPAAPARIHARAENGIGWIVLDNPRKHNAMALDMWNGITQALAAFARDASVRCVVVRGQGEKSFCSGADVAEKNGDYAARSGADAQLSYAALQAIRDFPRPVIAMVQGYCLGAGVSLALACDLRIAASSAAFGIPAARLGLAYSYDEVRRLAELVGPARSKQLLFSADRITAQRALQIGLVEEVVADADLLACVTALAGRIAANAPLTVEASKYTVDAACGDACTRDLAGCAARVQACFASADFVEGRLAFAQKRAPVFRGS